MHRRMILMVLEALRLLLPPILTTAAISIFREFESWISRFRLRGHRNLHLGCGPHALPGWANVDFISSPHVIGLDLRRPLPIADATIEFIFTEHTIEHLSLPDARGLIRECWRVLRPGGVLRVSTPDLSFLIEMYRQGRLDEWKEVGWRPTSPAGMVNEGMRCWGHQFIFDEKELMCALEAVGFVAERVAYGKSSYAVLTGLEYRLFHHELIIEAVRPKQ